MTAEGVWDLPSDEASRRLRRDYGAAWMIWYVPCWDCRNGRLTWCARRLADRALLHAAHPGHLAEYIHAASAEAAALVAGVMPGGSSADVVAWDPRSDGGVAG